MAASPERDMTALVTGAVGHAGRAFCRAVADDEKGDRMPVRVHDYRTDIADLPAHPARRGRSMRRIPAPVGALHRHGLGGGIFLALEGQCAFLSRHYARAAKSGGGGPAPPQRCSSASSSSAP